MEGYQDDVIWKPGHAAGILDRPRTRTRASRCNPGSGSLIDPRFRHRWWYGSLHEVGLPARVRVHATLDQFPAVAAKPVEHDNEMFAVWWESLGPVRLHDSNLPVIRYRDCEVLPLNLSRHALMVIPCMAPRNDGAASASKR